MGKFGSLDSLLSNNWNIYKKYRNANKILHLTAIEDECEIVEKLVCKKRANDDFRYCPWYLAYGNLPNDEVMFPEKYVPNLFCNNYAEYDMVVVWHSTDVNSLMFFYCMCHRFMTLDIPLYEIDIQGARELFDEYQKRFWSLKVNAEYADIANINAVTPGLLQFSERQVMQVDKDDMCECASVWKKLVSEQTGLRIYKEDVIISVNENHYDHLILSAFSENDKFYKCALIIGTALSETPYIGYPGDSYMYERLGVLAKQGKVELKTIDDFDYKAYRASQILMEGYSEEKFDEGWLTDILPPIRVLMARKIDKK